MLANTKSQRRAPGSRSGKTRRGTFRAPIGRLASLALARPGTVALILLFGGVGLAISVNALWLQKERHPLPLFRPATQRQATVAPQASAPPAPVPRPAEAVAPAAPAPPLELHSHEAQTKPTPKPEPHRKDPIGDLIGTAGPAPMPPVRPAKRKQSTETPSKPKNANDAMAALVERSTASR